MLKIIHTTIQNSVAQATRVLVFVHPWLNYLVI
jgi:hypothetical protein